MALTQVKTSGIADDAVTLAKQAGGTDGQVITFDASGNPVAVGPGTDGQVLTSTGAGSPPAFETISTSDTLSFRNLVINGAMNVAQRGTSSSGGSYKTVDRLDINVSGQEEYPTQSQQTLTSSDTGPWAKGFKRFYRVQNGNQTGGADTGAHVKVRYKFEAQDIANSDWECANTNSYITISFWVRSSVAQTYYVNLKTEDGTAMQYSFAYTPSANTWLKVEHSVPGHASLQFDSNNALGLTITFSTFEGTNNTHSGASNNSWRTYDGGTLTLDQTSTWYTTNDATWDLTGLQVEAGSTATNFEHRSFSDEVARCQRYYFHIPTPVAPGTTAGIGNGDHFGLAFNSSTSNARAHIVFPVPMRTDPSSLEWSGTQGDYMVGSSSGETQCNGNLSFSAQTAWNTRVNFPASSLTAGQATQGMAYNGSAFLGFEAEL